MLRLQQHVREAWVRVPHVLMLMLTARGQVTDAGARIVAGDATCVQEHMEREELCYWC